LALIFASIVVVTGLASSWIQLQAVAPLWTTPYGRVLLIKLALVVAVGAAGAYNWRVATPRLLEAGGVARIRLVMLTELAFAILVLAVTSVLVATPPPGEAMDAATTEASPR
jgi:putative copper export protein